MNTLHVSSSTHNSRSKTSENTQLLLSDWFFQHTTQLVAFDSSSKSKTDTCVARSRLNDDTTRLELALFLGSFDHLESNSIFRWASWIHEFTLYQEFSILVLSELRQVGKSDERSVSNSLENRVTDLRSRLLFFDEVRALFVKFLAVRLSSRPLAYLV